MSKCSLSPVYGWARAKSSSSSSSSRPTQDGIVHYMDPGKESAAALAALEDEQDLLALIDP